MTPGWEAALSVAREVGLSSGDYVLLQETNNTVVWLRPHPVIAKVGGRVESAESLIREHAVARQLAAVGAPVAAPLEGMPPVRDEATGLVVTLWHRMEHDAAIKVPDRLLARSLRQVHDALGLTTCDLPSFRVGMARAREMLADDDRMNLLRNDDRVLLRDCFDDLVRQLDDRRLPEQRLHGEPHIGNCLSTSDGPCWIDFENVCIGPLEWDLTFLPAGARRTFKMIDRDLFALLSALNSVMIATFCWAQAKFPEMRGHGEHHLGVVRASWPRLSQSIRRLSQDPRGF